MRRRRRREIEAPAADNRRESLHDRFPWRRRQRAAVDDGGRPYKSCPGDVELALSISFQRH